MTDRKYNSEHAYGSRISLAARTQPRLDPRHRLLYSHRTLRRDVFEAAIQPLKDIPSRSSKPNSYFVDHKKLQLRFPLPFPQLVGQRHHSLFEGNALVPPGTMRHATPSHRRRKAVYQQKLFSGVLVHRADIREFFRIEDLSRIM